VDEQFNRRDQQFEQALREMHDLTAAVRKLVDVILTRWGTPPGSAGRIAAQSPRQVGASDLERRVVPDGKPW
jgi:hypothetical protein